MLLGATSLVINGQTPEFSELSSSSSCCCKPTNDAYPKSYYRCRSCQGSTLPAFQYQTAKIIQNTVRVPSSLYTMNLGSLSGYEYATPLTNNVCWNQMSDRVVPHIQPSNLVASGSQYGGNSTRRTITRLRPGALSPGGKGVDIKHNFYERRLNRLKGRSVLRRGVIPPTYGAPIPFNPAYPVYGNKTVKTAIGGGCACPLDSGIPSSLLLTLPQLIYSVEYQYTVGQAVYTEQFPKQGLVKAIIIDLQNSSGLFTVQFEDASVQLKSALQILPYFDCACSGAVKQVFDMQSYYENVFSVIQSFVKAESSFCQPNALIHSQIQGLINTLNYT